MEQRLKHCHAALSVSVGNTGVCKAQDDALRKSIEQINSSSEIWGSGGGEKAWAFLFGSKIVFLLQKSFLRIPRLFDGGLMNGSSCTVEISKFLRNNFLMVFLFSCLEY